MIIKSFKPFGGHHCITNSLRQIFEYNKFQISEQMLFGIGSGLGFVYVNLANSPMISCRIKPLELEQNISNRLKISIKPKTPTNYEKAFKTLIEQISLQNPVMIYVDMCYLKYMNLDENNHFGGHSIVVFGYDDNEKCFYVSDRDSIDWQIQTPKGKIASDFHKVSYSEMEKARNSSHRPFPANNKWVKFDFSCAKPIDNANIFKSIQINIESMLNPPANLLGINGIRKFAKEIKKWKSFTTEKKKLAGITNYFMINADGGTGGGAFRNLYGNFLIEIADITKNKDFANVGNNYLQIGYLWEQIATEMINLYNSANDLIIDKLPSLIIEIADKEENELKRLQTMINKYN